MTTKFETAFVRMLAAWHEAAEFDPEIGGDELPISISEGKRVIKRFTDKKTRPKFMEMLEVTGVGSHPEMIRFLVRVGRKIED